jgi:Protein of unknown function (DUF1194)
MGKHGEYRALVGAAVVALGAVPAGAACRLALALGFDVSHSVSAADYRLQKSGLIDALNTPGIRAALLDPADHVRIAVFEWSGSDVQDLVMDWHEVSGTSDLDAILAVLSAHERLNYPQPTALGAALRFGWRLLEAERDCDARTLDMSGDGRNNVGPDPLSIYAQADFGDITVNGLTIARHEADIAEYYIQHVIRGEGAFVEQARTHEDFPVAIRRKLERELTTGIVGALGMPNVPG